MHISDIQPYDQGGNVSPAAGHDASSAGGVHIAWEEEEGGWGAVLVGDELAATIY